MPKIEILPILLVGIALLSPVFVAGPVSGLTPFAPGATKGQWVYYGQISTTLQTDIPGITSNPFITPFTHVTGINSTVTDVTVTNITLTQVWTFDNTTSPKTFILQGNVITGAGNFTSFGITPWFIAGGLSAGDSVGVGGSPTLNSTIVGSYAQSFWAMNIENLTFNFGGVQQVIPFLWEKNTGLLFEHTYLVSYSNNYGLYENGSLDVKATATNIPRSNPDFTLTSSTSSLTTTANTTSSTTLTLSTPDDLTVTMSFSVSPAGLVCTISPSVVNVKTPTNSTLSCRGPAGNYRLTVSGTSGARSHSQSLTYIVNTPASPTILGLTPLAFYAIVAAAVGIAAVVASLALLRRKSKVQSTLPSAPQPSEMPPPSPAPPPAGLAS